MLDVATDDLAEEDQGEEEHNKEEMDQQQKSNELGDLDIPPSWSPKLEIDPQKWALGFPMGEMSKFYKRCRVDFYGPYVETDGLIQRGAYYEDYKRLRVKEIRYFYYARSDKLV